MKLYLDTEYNGFGGELISMALVHYNTKLQWYEVCDYSGMVINQWVAQNVIPVIGKEPLREKLFRSSFHQFIQQFAEPEVICDWNEDAVHFCRMLQGWDFGSSLDFPCQITIMKTPPGQPVSKIPHNALADAIALRDWDNSRVLTGPRAVA